MKKYIVATLLLSAYVMYNGQVPINQAETKINSGQAIIYDTPVKLTSQNSDITKYGERVVTAAVLDVPSDMAIENSTTLNFVAELLNGEFTDERTYEFDVFMNSLSGNVIITEYQVALDFNHGIASNLSDLTFSYINGSSQLNNKPSHAIGITSGRLTCAVGAPLADTVSASNKRMGRFRLLSSEPFLILNPLIEWSFDFPINTIIGKNGVDITQYGEFIKGSTSMQGMYAK